MLYMNSVTKKEKNKYLVDGFDLHAPRGSLYALLGAPGSGKSAVLKLAAGLMKPDRGTVTVDGIVMEDEENRKKKSRIVGYMDQENGIYPRLRVLEYLEFYAHIYGFYGLSARERCLELLRMADLERRADTAMDDLPDSSLRCMEFLRTLMHNPPLLLLDAPFLGMDSHDRMMVQEILSQLAAQGTTVVMTSSALTDGMDFCQSIGLIDGGRMMAQGSREEVMGKVRESAPLYIEIGNEREKAVRLLHDDPCVKSLAYDKNYFRVHYAGNRAQEAELLRHLIEEGIAVGSFHRGQGSLEELISHLA